MYHLKEVVSPVPGNLDLNIADEEEFSPDKLRSNLERLYMTVVSIQSMSSSTSSEAYNIRSLVSLRLASISFDYDPGVRHAVLHGSALWVEGQA